LLASIASGHDLISANPLRAALLKSQ